MADIAALRSRISAINSEIFNLRGEIQQNQATLTRLQEQLASGASFYDTNITAKTNLLGSIDTYRITLAQDTARLDFLAAQISDLEAQIQIAIGSSGSLPISSSAQVVREQQIARDDNSSPSNPPPVDLTYDKEQNESKPKQSPVVTNAEQTQVAADSPTSVSTTKVPIEQSQATPPNTERSPVPQSLKTANAASDDYQTPPGTGFSGYQQIPGTGAASDDNSGFATPASTKATIDTLFSGTKFEKPLPNELGKYSSYTFNFSLYIMGQDAFKQMITSGQKNIAGSQLLVQSGGAPVSGSAGESDIKATTNGYDVNVSAPRTVSGRNQYFPVDFYIDEVVIDSKVSGKGAQGAHNVVGMKFKLFEPNGISLMQRFVSVVKDYVGKGQPLNYASQHFLMVIRFYGYDANGNLVRPSGTVPGSTSDPYSIVEKWIPFKFTAIKFRIANAITEYDCECVCPQNEVGTGQARGTVPFNVQFTGKTLKDIFSGSTDSSATNSTSANPTATTNQQPGETSDSSRATAATQNPPPKAGAAAQSGQRFAVGICEALNQFQQERIKEGQYRYADEYVIKLLPPLDSATIKPPGDLNLKYTPMLRPETAAQQWLGSKQLAQTENKNFNAFAGQSIVQFIDLAVRSSSYIYDQQIWNVVTDSEGRQTLESNGSPARNLAWYRIGVQVEPLQYDDLRKDWTYRITYQVNPYLVANVKSNYFVQSPVQVPHKEYNYWFTGQNTDILNFTQDFNYLYYIVNNAQAGTGRRITNWQDIEKRVYQPSSNQSDQGAEGGVNEPGANAADYLYSPGETSRVSLTIVGDPAWIQQGDLWRGVAGTNTRMNYDKFEADGTINYEGREIQFRLNYNTLSDYDFQTGLMEPAKAGFGTDRQSGIFGSAQVSADYRAVEVISRFSKGKFTQDLTGTQIYYDNLVNSGSSVSNTDASRTATTTESSNTNATTTTPPPTNSSQPPAREYNTEDAWTGAVNPDATSSVDPAQQTQPSESAKQNIVKDE